MSSYPMGPGQYTTADGARATSNVEKPGMLGGFPLAAWPRRTAATVIDVLVTIWLPNELPAHIGGLVMVVLVVFNSVFMQSRTCQSFGKVIMGIYLVWPSRVGDDGMYPAYPSMLRCLLRIPAHLLDLIFFIGFLRPLWDPYRRTFADSTAKTVVFAQPLNFFQMPMNARSSL